MEFFQLLKIDINAGIEVYKMAKDPVLVDVRSKEEFDNGHIPGSINIPLSQFGSVPKEIPDKTKPVFLYCQSGARSQRARRQMIRAGYIDVTNIGGFSDYTGSVERSS